MKKLLSLSIALFIGLSVVAQIKIPEIVSKTTVKHTIIKYVDGVTFELIGSDTKARRDSGYLANYKPASIINTLATNIYKSSQAVVKNGLVQSIPDSKSGETIYRQGSKPKLTSAILANGGIFINNEPDVYFATNTLGKKYSFPCEFHYVIYASSFFDYEALNNIYGIYFGFANRSVRLKNNADVFSEKDSLPMNQNVHIRIKYTADRKGEVWINGKKLSGQKDTFFTNQNNFPDHLGFGTNTNNSFVSYLALYGFNKELSDAESALVGLEISKEFNIGKKTEAPFLENCSVAVKDGLAYIIGKYQGKNPIKSSVIKWVVAGNGSNPDVTGSYYNERLNGLNSFKLSDFNLSGYWVRPEITITDIKDLTLGIPTSKGFVRLN